MLYTLETGTPFSMFSITLEIIGANETTLTLSDYIPSGRGIESVHTISSNTPSNNSSG